MIVFHERERAYREGARMRGIGCAIVLLIAGCAASQSKSMAEQDAERERHAEELRQPFSPDQLAARERARLNLTSTDPSIEDIRKMSPEMAGARDEDFVAAYRAKKAQSASDAGPQPNADDQFRALEDARTEREKKAAESRRAMCDANKAVGFPVGVFGGDRTRDGKTADCKITSWLSLHVAADADGCVTWHAMSRDELACDSGRSMPTTCIEKGTATVEKKAGTFALTTTVESKGSGGAPSRYHIWRCAGGRVRTDMKADLHSKGCTLLGSDANPTEERAGDVVCQSARLFDDGGTVTPAGKDAVRVTLAGGEVLTLNRADTTDPASQAASDAPSRPKQPTEPGTPEDCRAFGLAPGCQLNVRRVKAAP
jgi:hypothetical protein